MKPPVGQYIERLWLICVEAAEAIMHLNDVSVAYDNWFWLIPNIFRQNFKKLGTPTVVDSERRTVKVISSVSETL